MLFTTLALLVSAPQAAPLSLEHRMLLRCSAAFAQIAFSQESGDAAALQYPDLRQQGREFFVLASAQVMDEAGLDRAQIAEALTGEARDLHESGTLAQVLPPCLALLPPQ
jgi:hypothetical protein